MAREPVYRAGTDPGNTPAVPGVSAEAMGAGVGRAIGNLGQATENFAQAVQQREREVEAADVGVRVAELNGEIDVLAQERRENAAAGGAGHTEGVIEEFDRRATETLAGIRNDRVRRAYSDQLARDRARILSREDGWQRGASIEHRVERVDRAGTLIANGQATDPTPEGLEAGLEQIETQVSAMGLSADLTDATIREQQRKVVAAWGNAMVEINHGALIEVIDEGALNAYLEPEDIDRLRDGAMVEGRRLAAAERARQATVAAEARETLSLFNRRIAAGDEPSDAEFDEMAELATAIGDEGRLFDVQVARQEVRVNRETSTWTPIQFEQAINTLRQKGEDRTTAENIQLRQLEQIRASRVSEFVNDPHGAAARGGSAPPPVDWANPTAAQLDARASWARGFAQANGLVSIPYLSTEEMRPLEERLEQGAPGLVEVARTLRTQWGTRAAGQIAQQLQPNDRDLQLMVGLPITTQNLFVRGAEARRGNSSLFDRQVAAEVFAEHSSAIPQALRPAVFEAAANISSGLRDNYNEVDFDEDTFVRAIEYAMGGTGPRNDIRGGLGEWQDDPIWLPPDLTQGDFEERLARATGQAFVEAAVDGQGNPHQQAPRYMGADGRPGGPISPEQLRQLRFETVSPGVYRLVGPIGGALVDADGRQWQFDVRRLP